MLEEIERAEFKNEQAKQMCLAVARNLKDFEARKKGSNFRAILLTIADTFTEDKLAIYELFNAINPNKKVPSGKSNFYAGGKASIGGKSAKNCESCPDGISSDMEELPKKENAFKSVKDVLIRFESNVNAMKAFAQNQGIAIPEKTNKAETIARAILKHYK